MDKIREELIKEILKCFFKTVKTIHCDNTFELKPFNLKNQQIEILFLVGKSKKGISVGDLAKSLNVTNGAITQQVDELVERKLLIRKDDENDRRIVNILLSDLAHEKSKILKDHYFKKVGPMFKDLSEDELKSLSNLIKKVKFN